MLWVLNEIALVTRVRNMLDDGNLKMPSNFLPSARWSAEANEATAPPDRKFRKQYTVLYHFPPTVLAISLTI